MALHIDSFTFRIAATDLQSTAKRYTSRFSSRNGLTLLFAHCVGSRTFTTAHAPCFIRAELDSLDKEQWEPTIEQIFRLQQQKDQRDRIREAWAFDWQSHGDAAIINARVLDSRKDAVCQFKNHGLRSIPKPDGEAVGLKASKKQEGMAYPQFPPYIESVTLFRERSVVWQGLDTFRKDSATRAKGSNQLQ
ncbi:hypothetical protein C0989_009276 [Termitomyces sp. Mn162]|nr:hypothetical protein C0989_009276 [Termitomyces sp. Mn162]